MTSVVMTTLPPRFNRAETALHMGVSVSTLDRWVREGCPVAQRGSRGIEWAFELAAVVKWQVERIRAEEDGQTRDLVDIELRTKRAVMLKAELDLAKAKGEVASIREFELVQAKAMAAVRTRIMNVPQRVAMLLLGETNETTFKARLADELRLALESASESDLTIDEDDDGDEQPV